MIHEALMYLWNCPGSFCEPNAEEEWLNMVDVKDFIHPGERKLLQRIMKIALDYHNFQTFIKQVLELNTRKFNASTAQEVFQGGSYYSEPCCSKTVEKPTIIEDKPDKPVDEIQDGLYIKAFCNGLDDALEPYRQDIIDLEESVLKDPQLPLTFVYSKVDKYRTLFDAFKSMIQTIKTERLHGCLLMGRLMKYYNCGIQQVAVAVSRIICQINVIFYRHLCNWIIFGDLIDIYQEFFVADAKCPDEDFLWSFSDAKNEAESLNETSKGFKIRRPPKVRKFYLRENMIPQSIRLELAQTILFMGRMVWIIRNDPTDSQDDKLKLKLKRDIWEGKEVFYFKKLRELEKQPFNLGQFEKAIEDCRLCITKYLWTVMVEEAKLLDHLQLIRDYYAMGRGELFQQFIMTVRDKCKDTPPEYFIYKLNSIFNETAKKLYTDQDKTHERFELYFPSDSQATSTKHVNLWHVKMHFGIVWPLHIIFHPGAMILYNKLFNFLLRIKKAQYDLEKLWLTHMEGKREIHKGVWTLRNTLMFLINNIQYYMQVDVIEAQFEVLKKAINSTKNVEDIIKLHAEFLGNIMSRTFLMTANDDSGYPDTKRNQLYKLPSLDYNTTKRNHVYSTLLLFLDLCDEFCLNATFWGGELTKLDEKELGKLQQKCDRLVEHLLSTLYSLREHVVGSHLLQLLHRIDFNRYFSKNSLDLNLSSR